MFLFLIITCSSVQNGKPAGTKLSVSALLQRVQKRHFAGLIATKAFSIFKP